jgi:hypothetical protein
MFVRRMLMIGYAAAFVLAVSLPASADLESLTDAEFKCRDHLAKTLANLGKQEAKCSAKCRKNQLETNCAYPPSGSETDLCLTKAWAKVEVLKPCADGTTDDDPCPEGYERVGGSCEGFVSQQAGQISSLVGVTTELLSCDDTTYNLGEYTEAEFTCGWKAMLAYAKWGSSRAKCYRLCRVLERKGLTNGNCDPSGVTDTQTLDCLSKAGGKLTKKLAAVCADPPECSHLDEIRDDTVGRLVDEVATMVSNPSVSPTCGNGIREYPEQCDPPGGDPVAECGYATAVCTATCECEPAKVIFVTSGSYQGDFGGLAGADAICQASSALLGGTFKAWLSDTYTSAADRLTHAVGHYVDVNGVKIADDWNDLTDGTIDNPISVNENGVSDTNLEVWTGTHTDGTSYLPLFCLEWTYTNPADMPVYGTTGTTSFGWTQSAHGSCDVFRHLYCVQQ